MLDNFKYAMAQSIKAVSGANRIMILTDQSINHNENDSLSFLEAFWYNLTKKFFPPWLLANTIWQYMPHKTWYIFARHFNAISAEAEKKLKHGYPSLVQLEKMFDDDKFHIITCNVDCLHEKAGSSPEKIKELYGNIRRFKCVNSSHANPNSDSDTLPLMPPQCIHIGCDSIVRPDCVLYSEIVPVSIINESLSAIKEMTDEDVIIIMGSSESFSDAGNLPWAAANQGATIIEMSQKSGRVPIGNNYIHLNCDSIQYISTIVEGVENFMK